MSVKCVVNMLRPNLISMNIINKTIYFLFILILKSWDFNPLLGKANLT